MVQMIDGFDWDRDDNLRGERRCGCLVGMMPSRYITFISYDGLLAVTYNARPPVGPMRFRQRRPQGLMRVVPNGGSYPRVDERQN